MILVVVVGFNGGSKKDFLLSTEEMSGLNTAAPGVSDFRASRVQP